MSEGEKESDLYLTCVWQANGSNVTSLDAADALRLTELLYDYGLFLVHPDYRKDEFPEEFASHAWDIIKPEHRLQFVRMELRNPLIALLAIPAAVGLGKVGAALGLGTAAVALAGAIVKLGGDIADIPVKVMTSRERHAEAKADAARARVKADAAPAIANAEVERAVAEADKAKSEAKREGAEAEKALVKLAEARVGLETKRMAQESVIRRLKRSKLRLVEEQISDEKPAA